MQSGGCPPHLAAPAWRQSALLRRAGGERGAPPFQCRERQGYTSPPGQEQSRGLRAGQPVPVPGSAPAAGTGFPRPQQGQRCRWSRSAGRRGQASAGRHRGSRPAGWRRGQHSPRSTPPEPPVLCGTFPRRNRGHPQRCSQKSSRTARPAGPGSRSIQRRCKFPCAPHSGRGSWRAGGGSHWR